MTVGAQVPCTLCRATLVGRALLTRARDARLAGGNSIKYAFIGGAGRCLSSCSDGSTAPNGDAATDAMASITAHEIVETMSDPLLNAWTSSSGGENGDR